MSTHTDITAAGTEQHRRDPKGTWSAITSAGAAAALAVGLFLPTLTGSAQVSAHVFSGIPASAGHYRSHYRASTVSAAHYRASTVSAAHYRSHYRSHYRATTGQHVF